VSSKQTSQKPHVNEAKVPMSDVSSLVVVVVVVVAASVVLLLKIHLYHVHRRKNELVELS